jgi:hypothetical protein
LTRYSKPPGLGLLLLPSPLPGSQPFDSPYHTTLTPHSISPALGWGCMSLRLTCFCRLPLRSWRVMSASSNIPSGSFPPSSFSSVHRAPDAPKNVENPLVTKVRRHQSHLPGEQQPSGAVDGSNAHEDDDRGGPKTLEQLQLRVLSRNEHFVVLNKGPDERMDGAFDVTLEKAVRALHVLQFVPRMKTLSIAFSCGV